MKRVFLILGLLLTLITISIGAIPAQAGTGFSQAPRIHIKQGTSTNWAGYAVQYPNLTTPQNDVVSDVKGSWTVPSVGTSSTAAYSAIWVGIDGYSNSSVEQIGTEQDSNGNYYAWYEMYPKPCYLISSVPIKPNDLISAEVKYDGKGSFTLILKDITTTKSFSITQKSGKAQCSSAEWIVEAPWSGGVLPLANFGTANITGASAVIKGNQANVNSWGSDCIDMVVSKTDPTVKAHTIPTNDGHSFSVVWNHN